MKHNQLTAALFLAGALQASLSAQTPFGDWTHASGNLGSLWVSPTGNDANSGLTPGDPFRTIGRALQEADVFLPITLQVSGTGVTINVVPGTYAITAPLDVPAFGISIEAAWDSNPAAEVVIQTAYGVPSGDIVRVDQPYGAGTAASLSRDQLAELPPSQIRGLHLIGEVFPVPGSALIDAVTNGVRIEVLSSTAVVPIASDVAFGVRECEIEAVSSAITVTKAPGDRIVYRNEVISCDLHPIDFGVRINGATLHSDLLRSNVIRDCRMGVVVNGAGRGFEGTQRPRILSNMITNIGSHNFAPVGGFPIGAGIEFTNGGSGQVVGNTIAFTRNSCPNPFTCTALPNFESSGLSYRRGNVTGGETLVVANNILFNPTFVIGGAANNPFEIDLHGQAFPGTFVVESNDFDATSPLVNGPGPISTSNVPIANPFFVNSTLGSQDTHLTTASLGVVGLGDVLFTEPSASSSFTINGTTFAANCALDVDLDARVHWAAGTGGATLRRGADQPVADVRLQAPTALAGIPAVELADRFGTIVASPNGSSIVHIEVTAPVGSAYVTSLCSTLPQGAELQQIAVSPFGSLAIDPFAGNAVTIDSRAGTTAPTTLFRFNAGQLVQNFREAEFYLQTLVFRPDGTATFTNRIRLEIDEN